MKPRIKEYELVSAWPDPEARKGSRLAYFANEWHDTQIYELSRLKPGNRIAGPAIIEDPTTTYVVPPDRAVEIDRFQSLWLKQK